MGVFTENCNGTYPIPDPEASDEIIEAFSLHEESCSSCSRRMEAALAPFMEAVEVIRAFSPAGRVPFSEGDWAFRDQQREAATQLITRMTQLHLCNDQGTPIEDVNGTPAILVLQTDARSTVEFSPPQGFTRFYTQDQIISEDMPMLVLKTPDIQTWDPSTQSGPYSMDLGQYKISVYFSTDEQGSLRLTVSSDPR